MLSQINISSAWVLKENRFGLSVSVHPKNSVFPAVLKSFFLQVRFVVLSPGCRVESHFVSQLSRLAIDEPIFAQQSLGAIG